MYIKAPVVIKGDKTGLKLILEEKATLEEITKTLCEKLRVNTQKERKKKPIYVTFEGKNLTKDEEDIIYDTLDNIGVIPYKAQVFDDSIIENTEDIPADGNGVFVIGTLKKGQVIESKKSIVILGDVEMGASVYSEANIVVVGKLNGYVEPGYKGRKDAFVYSLISGRNYS